MAKTKKKHSGKPRGMNYADMLARKRMIREAVQEAADDATVQLRADMATQKALFRTRAHEEVLCCTSGK